MKDDQSGVFVNFERALAKLVEFTAEPALSEREQAGVIQAFEFTFEQLWKALQRLAAMEGVGIASPKGALEFAIAKGMIDLDEEQTWIDMLRDRNLSSHTYNRELAGQIAGRVFAAYVPALKAFPVT